MTVSIHQPGRLFGQFVKSVGVGRGDVLQGEAFAKARGWTIPALALKAAVSPMDQAAMDGMLRIGLDLAEFLRPLTVLGRLSATMRKAVFRTRLTTTDMGGTGSWVEEGQAIPVRAMDLSALISLEPRRVASIVVMTNELLRSAETGTDDMVARDASASLIKAMDEALLDPANAGSDARPQAITNNAPSFESGGTSVAAIDADLNLMLASLTAADMPLNTGAWVMHPSSAAHLALLRGTGGSPAFPGTTARGGTLLGLPVLTTTVCTASGSPGEKFIVLLEAAEIMLADDGQASVTASSNAALQMADDPASGEQPLVSMFQHGLTALRTERHANWHRRRTAAVAVLRSVNF